MAEYIAAQREFTDAFYALEPMRLRCPGDDVAVDPCVWSRFLRSIDRLETARANLGRA